MEWMVENWKILLGVAVVALFVYEIGKEAFDGTSS